MNSPSQFESNAGSVYCSYIQVGNEINGASTGLAHLPGNLLPWFRTVTHNSPSGTVSSLANEIYTRLLNRRVDLMYFSLFHFGSIMALTPFCYDDSTIRTAGTIENPLFCLNDVCDILDITSSLVTVPQFAPVSGRTTCAANPSSCDCAPSIAAA